MRLLIIVMSVLGVLVVLRRGRAVRSDDITTRHDSAGGIDAPTASDSGIWNEHRGVNLKCELMMLRVISCVLNPGFHS